MVWKRNTDYLLMMTYVYRYCSVCYFFYALDWRLTCHAQTNSLILFRTQVFAIPSLYLPIKCRSTKWASKPLLPAVLYFCLFIMHKAIFRGFHGKNYFKHLKILTWFFWDWITFTWLTAYFLCFAFDWVVSASYN
jgi:hypothetical protein